MKIFEEFKNHSFRLHKQFIEPFLVHDLVDNDKKWLGLRCSKCGKEQRQAIEQLQREKEK